MYRGLRDEQGGKRETEFAFEFEEPHFITLGLLYEKRPRFAGGAFAPLLRRVDKFLDEPLRKAHSEREERAGRVEAADDALAKRVAELKKRGVNHPYVKNFVLARCSPLTRARKTVPSFDVALGRLLKALEELDASKVSYGDVARAGMFAGPPAAEG
jgi:ParB family chromosome partitioning protein